MINWKWYNFKTAAVRPSIGVQFFNKIASAEEFTPTQKLMLAKRRIFGCTYGYGYKAGTAHFRRTAMTKGLRRHDLAHANAIFPNWQYPLFHDQERKDWMKMIFDAKKLRIMMRGVKVGRKKGGGRVNLMSVFQTKGGVTATSDKAAEDQP